MKAAVTIILNVALFLTANAQYQNVNLGSGSEVAIMFDPNDPARMVAGANIVEVFYSTDSGQTWVQNQLTSTLSVLGDPVLLCDTGGNFYYFHLTSTTDRIVCQKSGDGGVTWNDGTFTGFAPPNDQDKEWAVVDWTNGPNRNTIYVVWADLDDYGSNNPLDSSRIMISKSTDQSATWSAPVKLSKTQGNCGVNSIKGAVPAIGPNGEVYVAWCGNGVSFQKSTDGGSTWLSQDVQVDTQPDWYFAVPGMTWGNGFPSIACDISGGPHTGNIYVAWADTRNGPTDTDVWLASSTDGGTTWNTIRVNDDITTNHNFHPWVCVDQVTGYVYVAFFDRRNYLNDTGTDVYLAYSTDGGTFYTNEKVSTSSFLGTAWDYNNCIAHNNMIRPLWAQNPTGVWTALIDFNDLPLGYDEKVLGNSLKVLQNFPNPFSWRTTVKFSLPEGMKVSARLYNMTGQEVALPVSDRWFDKGVHEFELYASDYSLAPGLYYCTLFADGHRQSIKMVLD